MICSNVFKCMESFIYLGIFKNVMVIVLQFSTVSPML